jgi:hypothetical protein
MVLYSKGKQGAKISSIEQKKRFQVSKNRINENLAGILTKLNEVAGLIKNSIPVLR